MDVRFSIPVQAKQEDTFLYAMVMMTQGACITIMAGVAHIMHGRIRQLLLPRAERCANILIQ